MQHDPKDDVLSHDITDAIFDIRQDARSIRESGLESLAEAFELLAHNLEKAWSRSEERFWSSEWAS